MTSTFSAIGHPFSFTWAIGEYDSDVKFLRQFIDDNQARPLDVLYEIHWRRRDDALELFEDGWYLTGVGHHELWCAATMEDAVDAAQEHILRDGSDPLNLPMESGERTEDGHLIHRMPALPLSVWHDDGLWFGMFSGKRPKREQ